MFQPLSQDPECTQCVAQLGEAEGFLGRHGACRREDVFVLDFPVIQCSVDLLSLTTDVLAALVSGLRRVETLVDVFLDPGQRDVCRTLIPWEMLRLGHWERQPAVIRRKQARLAGQERCVLLFRREQGKVTQTIGRLTSMMNNDHHRSFCSAFSESGLL